MFDYYLFLFIITFIIFINLSNKILIYLQNNYTLKISRLSYLSMTKNDQFYFNEGFCYKCKKTLDFFYFNPHFIMIEYSCKNCDNKISI